MISTKELLIGVRFEDTDDAAAYSSSIERSKAELAPQIQTVISAFGESLRVSNLKEALFPTIIITGPEPEISKCEAELHSHFDSNPLITHIGFARPLWMGLEGASPL